MSSVSAAQLWPYLANQWGNLSSALAPAGSNMGKLGESQADMAQSMMAQMAAIQEKKEQKKKKKSGLFGGIGSALGTIGGTMLGGPVGAAVGAGLGSAGGQAVGGGGVNWGDVFGSGISAGISGAVMPLATSWMAQQPGALGTLGGALDSVAVREANPLVSDFNLALRAGGANLLGQQFMTPMVMGPVNRLAGYFNPPPQQQQPQQSPYDQALRQAFGGLPY